MARAPPFPVIEVRKVRELSVIGQRTEVEMGFADRYGICRLAAPIAEAGMGMNLAKV
jgi:hypothetical protein